MLFDFLQRGGLNAATHHVRHREVGKKHSPHSSLSLSASPFDFDQHIGAVAHASRRLRGVAPSLLADVEAIIAPLCVLTGAILAEFAYYWLVDKNVSFTTVYLGAVALGALLLLVLASQFGLHSAARVSAGEFEARSIIATTSLTFLLLLSLFYLFKVSGQVSRGWFVGWYLLTLGQLLIVRLGILRWAQNLRSECRLLQRCAIYGDPKLGRHVGILLRSANPNLTFIGIFSDGSTDHTYTSPAATASDISNLELQHERDGVGDLSALISAVQQDACDRIIVAMPSNAQDRVRRATVNLEALPVDVDLSLDAIVAPRRERGWRNEVLLFPLQQLPISPRGSLIKSVIDYALSGIALTLFAPFMMLIALAIKLDSPGPVLFAQKRHGFNHRVMRVFKFRTMTVAEDGPEVRQAVVGDVRVTRVGRLLRRTSLDELPQLFNVLRGEMSLVGPRPHATSHNESHSKHFEAYPSRHKVKPGITGWAQVNGFRGETRTPEDMRARLEADLYYIHNWSPWLDLKILAWTLVVPFRGINAY
jgi:Undecaprenyl-phosphate glucose phosphotransferase